MRCLYSEGLIYGGKFAFQIDWASLIVERKFTVFALFYFVFEAKEDKVDREGIPDTHPIPQVTRLELFLESG